jgi:diguanylate cyclase (GGDEF)-like protein
VHRSLPDLSTRLASYETLLDVSRMLLVSATPDELFESISGELNRLVPVDALTIYRVDEVARRIVPVHARDQWADEIMAAPLQLGEGLTGWVVEHREAANVTAAEQDPRIAVVPGTPADEPEAIVCVPLVVRDRPIGTLNTYRLGTGAEFTDEEFTLVRRFADLAALALDNTQNRMQLLHEAQTDWLTALSNHRVYHERLHDEVDRAERYGRPLSLVVFDLDDFKLLNDVYGHQEGDLVLRRVAASAREELWASDLACRIGGEEFAIVMPETGKRAARAAADRLCARVRAIPGVRPTTVSCGVATFPVDAATATDLAAAADAALYVAKARGKDRAVSFTTAVLERRAQQTARGGDDAMAQLDLLAPLATRLDGLDDRDRIAAAAAEALVEMRLCDAATVRLFDPESGALVPVAHRGAARTDGACPALALPLAAAGQKLGSIELVRGDGGGLSDSAARIAEVWAAHVASALANAAALAAERGAAALAEGLRRIASAALGETSAGAVAGEVVAAACRLPGAAAASIVVTTGAGRRGRVLAAAGQASARSVCLAAALAGDPQDADVAVFRTADLPAVSVGAARRHALVAVAPTAGGRLAVVCDAFPEPTRAAVAALAAEGARALEHVALVATLRGADGASDLRRAGARPS